MLRRALALVVSVMCLQIASAAPSFPSDGQPVNEPTITRKFIPLGGLSRPKELNKISRSPGRERNVFVAATMDSSVAIPTLLIVGIVILLVFQIGSTVATLRLCEDYKCCNYYSCLLLMCVPFVILISGIVFLVRGAHSAYSSLG